MYDQACAIRWRPVIRMAEGPPIELDLAESWFKARTGIANTHFDDEAGLPRSCGNSVE